MYDTTKDPQEAQAKPDRSAEQLAAHAIATRIRHALDHPSERWINSNDAVTWSDLLFILDDAAENDHSAEYRKERAAAGIAVGDKIVTG